VQDTARKVAEFIKKKQMLSDDIDMERNCRLFLDEMQKGLEGTDSSLSMIPTYIETDIDVPSDKPVIVADAGGTHFRVATISFDRQKTAKIENFQSYSMPGTKKNVTRLEFFTLMASYMDKVLDASNSIGFCFSYPTDILPNKDGRLVRFSKEIKAKQVRGQLIGENLNLAINAAGHPGKKHVVILNDTVTTLLAGKSVAGCRDFSAYIGFILGTGTNCCYSEKNSNITKNKDLDPGRKQIINIESGSFAKAPRGRIDLQFDNSTLDPGMSTFEKMISGAYLGPLCLEVACAAAAESLFSSQTTEELNAIDQIDTKDISDFMHNPRGDNPLAVTLADASQDDIDTLDCLIDSVVLKTDAGKNPDSPVCIVAEGSTFYGLKTLKERVEDYLTQYLENQKQRYFEIVNVENATLIGAAIAGLTN